MLERKFGEFGSVIHLAASKVIVREPNPVEEVAVPAGGKSMPPSLTTIVSGKEPLAVGAVAPGLASMRLGTAIDPASAD
jgi:hypothetical protein